MHESPEFLKLSQTFIFDIPDESEGHLAKRQHDSRVSILEKQLEYMRRLVHNAEQERSKAAERMCAIEQEKENQVS